MASPGKDTGPNTHSDHQEPTELTPEPAFQEAQKWIEAVTGRSFGDKDFRNGLENGILLCELLSSIKPGLVKKINRLPTPIAGLDNLTMFLRGCEELGLKGSQLFGPGDLQDTSVRANLTGSDCSRKLKNVLITIYWLGKTANSCASYNGPTLDLKEFEGLLSMMRKKECVSEESDSPKRSVRDSGYIDNWESERSESLSPPGHGREDSFDSLDSFGSRSQQTPSPDTVLRGNSDDSEGDSGPRRLPDVRKDDMSARRVSYKEPRAARPFNQYLPNKSNQTNYIPAPLRKRRSDQEEERWSTSNATSPVGGEHPLSGGTDYAPTPALPSDSLQPLTPNPKGPLTQMERKALEDRLAEKAKDERKREEEEEEEEQERQPDLEKDDMMARRTGAFQRASGGKVHNWFLPVPGGKRDPDPLAGPAALESSQPGSGVATDPLMLEKRIKTKRFKVGQRAEPMHVQPKVLAVPLVAPKEPGDPDLTSTPDNVHVDLYDYIDGDEYDEGLLPDLKKDDMLIRRIGVYHTPSGSHTHSVNVFLPKPRAVECKTGHASGQHKSHIRSTKQEQKHTQDSFTPSPVTAPSADVENMTRKCAQMMESQEAGTMGVKGGENEIVGGAQAYSPPLIRAPNPQCTFFLADDDLPQIFSHKAASVSDETESISLIDMRDEEEADPLSSHSQSRHESMHNQYNKLREEEEHWQDDLARWKNRRRCASQDLIRKEEERKMMEKLMYSEGGAHRRKSIKTYKEIVEEKERREQELHELYCKASTPEEKATVLQRYALRFTISDAILEKLQLPKLPSVATAGPALPQDTYTLSEKVEVLGPPVSTQSQKQLFAQPHMPMTQSSTHSRPKTPELSPSRRHNAPEVPVSLTWLPPPPSKPVPLLTPKPYCQPKFNQVSYKQVKTDGLVRMNGECNVEVTRESSLGATPSPIEALSHSPHSRQEISPASEDMAQKLTKTLPTQQLPVATSQETELAKEEREGSASPQERVDEEETPTAHADSQLAAGKQVVPSSMKCSSVIKTTIVTELTQTHPLPTTDMPSIDKDQKSHDELSSSDSGKADVNSCSLSLTESSHTSSSSRLRWEFFAPTEGLDFTSECIETPILNLAKRLDHWTWDPNEERKRQERWQQEQERLLQEKYQQEQERLKQEWEKAQKEVEEEGRRHYEEEQRILEETTSPLTPRSSALSLPSVTEALPLSVTLHDIAAPSPADQDRKPELLNKQTVMGEKNGLQHSSDQTEAIVPVQHNGQGADHQESQSATPQLQFIQDESWSCKSECRPEWKKTASLDRNMSPSQTQPPRMRRIGSYENILGMHPSKSLQSPQDTPPTSTSRSVSGKKLCSSCAQPLGKGAAMIIETLGLYFHTQCFKCGVCKGLLGETSAGTDVRIRNGVLSCQDCYIKSRAAGQPTTL
ncbi:LIM and calponin homology domains-containing protein 1a isoform X14 [Electrophorus electricus]|uniref:LIM and calponin homology domains-containing protein 1a isoform X14 n=1 Tax=Electrophorus electricus TaxID=8005 RepID=UPI0015D0A953|nr:LIM and calponin homology domains-containing protein 1a isoform X14 [Electrophorus electricus]